MKPSRRWKLLTLLWLPVALAACGQRIQSAGPDTETPRIVENRIITADGSALPMRSWLPDATPRAIILALHGFNDYSMTFDRPGRYWATRGIATYAIDQRGFGSAPHPGYWAHHHTLAGDAATALGLLRARHPGTPAFVLGNSMGAAIAMIADAQGLLACDGLILVGPALRGRHHLGIFQSTMLWLTALVFPGMRFGMRNLRVTPSDNTEMLRALSRDPLVIKKTRTDAVKGLVDTMDAALNAAHRVRTPSLILYGNRDTLVPLAGVADVIAALPAGGRHRIAAYRNGWHMLLRDLNAGVVHADIAAWIFDQNAPLASGADTAGQALKKRL